MVLVDAAHEDAGTIQGMPHRDRPKIPRALIHDLSIVLGHLGMARAVARQLGPVPQDWTPEEWDVLGRLERQRGTLLADAHEGPERATADLVRSADGLDELPLIVLTQGKLPPVDAPEARAVQRGWIGLQRQLAQRSRRGRQVVVTESGRDYLTRSAFDEVS